jgi:hypothetical protein
LIDPSILKTERPPVTCARSKSFCGGRNRPTAPQAPPVTDMRHRPIAQTQRDLAGFKGGFYALTAA